ncbi:HlyU family transcriptional regulator [Pelagovum pacificum]|uniref:Uncharacterized protein n=1 Tax=Pelagovum pacificum TaxID=2588711 RepID=A0A5C5G7Y3_9RHOB|nr:HlyU family transcriptional regulator [Pelagovum pacificum]QQA41544.1 hypothetical protein I8N54_11985 [Pelagovum pacificum]TNY30824.1 hypothetical protein FHY64_17060 [Pelagovum pacificum]
MSFLSKLFGGKSSSSNREEVKLHSYKGFDIYPDPMSDGGSWRIAARIEKTVEGELKVHQLVRADTFQDKDVATKESIAKAELMIDQEGERIFG